MDKGWITDSISVLYRVTRHNVHEENVHFGTNMLMDIFKSGRLKMDFF